MVSKEQHLGLFSTYAFGSNEAWLVHKGRVQLVSNNPEAELLWVKAAWYQANVVSGRAVLAVVVAHDFDPTWVFTAAVTGPSPISQTPYTLLPPVTYNNSSPWTLQKQVALAQRLPHGTIIHTSFTDRQPLNGWLATHAVREMWQNLRDGVTAQFGGLISPAVSPSSTHYHVTSAAAGRVVATVDVSESHVLRLLQQEVVLLPKHLQLASFKDPRSAGCHGEGFKLGINLLLRQGYTVTYAMPGQIWTFYMAAVFAADLRNMSIRMDHGPDRDDMEICISGPWASSLFLSNMDWELTDSLLGAKAFTFKSSKGTVAVSCESAAWGRVYSRNLYVDLDKTMEVLQLALNVQTQQPRDRHVLQSGLVSELSGILLAWLGEFMPATDFTPLFVHIFERMRTEKNNPLVRAAATALREVVRSFHAKKLMIRADLIIYMDESADIRTLEVLKQVGKHVVDNAGALGDTVDLHQLTVTLIKDCPAYAPTDPGEIRNLRVLGLFVDGLSLNTGLITSVGNWVIHLHVRLSTVIRFCHLDTYGRVYMTCDMLQDANFRTAATEIFGSVVRYVKGDTMILSDMLGSFLSDPLGFVPTKLVPATRDRAMSSNNATSSVYGGGSSGGDGAGSVNGGPPWTGYFHDVFQCFRGSVSGAADASGSGVVASKDESSRPAPFEAIEVLPDGVDAKVRQCAFSGVPTEFLPLPTMAARAADHDHSRCEGPPGLQLSPFVIGGETIYLDKRLNSGRLHQLLNGADARVVALSTMVRKITQNVATTLSMELSSIPVVMVVCDDVLGFTQLGGVYINIAPLLREPVLEKAHRQSLFMTLLHELAHRTHVRHDTYFSDEMARLVFFCRNCLDFD